MAKNKDVNHLIVRYNAKLTIFCKKILKHQWYAGYSVNIIISNGKDSFAISFTIALTIDFLKKVTLSNIKSMQYTHLLDHLQ